MDGSETLEGLASMSIEGHLDELRRRIVVSLVTVGIGSVAGWFLVPSILQFFAGSVNGPLYFISPGEAFFSYLKLSIISGLCIGAPVLLTQAWGFVLPALYPGERQIFGRYIPAIILLFVAGVSFGVFVVYPVALEFFLSVGGQGLDALPSIGRFISFVIGTTVPFGLVFQLPVLMIALAGVGTFTADDFRERRKGFYFASFVIGAMLTPSDVASQVLMAVPMIVLYESGILLVSHRLFMPPPLEG